MKKLILPVLLMLIAFTTQAQTKQDRKNDRSERMERRGDRAANMDPEAMASVKAKKMTLVLDLSDKQEAQVEQVLMENAMKRKAAMVNKSNRKTLSKEEKLSLAEARLDQRIAVKRAFKDILNDEQYEKFEKMSHKRKRGKRNQVRKVRRTRK